MPYKYKNVLNFQGSEEAIRSAMRAIAHPQAGNGTIDFQAITPMPPWVSGNSDPVASGDTLMEKWCLENWGVRANASGLMDSARSYDGGTTIEFDTIGGHVRELMGRLSMMFPHSPDLIVDYLWASENVGWDCGMVQFQRGETLYEFLPDPGSLQCYELAFDILGTNAGDHGLVYDEDSETYHYGGNLIGGADDN